jgi:hypothetical protein
MEAKKIEPTDPSNETDGDANPEKPVVEESAQATKAERKSSRYHGF